MSSGFITKKVAFVLLVIYLTVLAISGVSSIMMGSSGFLQGVFYSSGMFPQSLEFAPVILSVISLSFLALIGICFYEISIVFFTQADIQKEILSELKALRSDVRKNNNDSRDDVTFNMENI